MIFAAEDIHICVNNIKHRENTRAVDQLITQNQERREIQFPM